MAIRVQIPTPMRQHTDNSQSARKALNRASGIVFAVAVLQVVFGALALVSVPKELHPHEEILVTVYIIEFGLGLWFAGLGIGARYQPLTVTMIGLASYIAVMIGDGILVPQYYRVIIAKSLVLGMLLMSVHFANTYTRLQRLHRITTDQSPRSMFK